jgi:sugar phosphate isomerase/epimerase
MNVLNRREFVGAALTGAAAAYAKTAEPHDKFPTQPRERLAVSTYPFRSLIEGPHRHSGEQSRPGMSLPEFARAIPGKLNVHGIEPWSPHFQSTEPGYVGTLHESFQSAGLRVVNIPVDARVRLCGSAEDREAGVAIYRKWVDAAVILRSPSIRIHLPHAPTGQEVECAVNAFKPLVEYGASKNIAINLENDVPETEQPERIVQVIKEENSPFLRALPDFCNSMQVHDRQDYNDQAMKMLFPLAFNISHVKDQEEGGGKTLHVDVDHIFAIAKDSGYRGFFSMEWEGTGDPYDGTRALIEASLRNLG